MNTNYIAIMTDDKDAWIIVENEGNLPVKGKGGRNRWQRVYGLGKTEELAWLDAGFDKYGN
jgi:hypothetical protein